MTEPQFLVIRRSIGHQVAVLPGDAYQHLTIFRIQFFRREVKWQRFFRVEFLFESLALFHQLVGGLRCADRSSEQAQQSWQDRDAAEKYRLHAQRHYGTMPWKRRAASHILSSRRNRGR